MSNELNHKINHFLPIILCPSSYWRFFPSPRSSQVPPQNLHPASSSPAFEACYHLFLFTFHSFLWFHHFSLTIASLEDIFSYHIYVHFSPSPPPFYSSSLFHTELSSVPPFSPPFPLFSCNSSLLQCFATPTSLLARHHCHLVPASLLDVHPDFTLLIWNESALKNISPHGCILQFNPNIS